MEDENNRLRNDSMGTNYTFRDKNGNLVNSNELGLLSDHDLYKSDQKADSDSRFDSNQSKLKLIQYSNRSFAFPDIMSLEHQSDDQYQDERESQEADEQPSMMTNSELRSIDLNILGECYVPSSDMFSDRNMQENTDTEELEVKAEQNQENMMNRESRNDEVVRKRDKNGNKIDSMDSQKIDSLLRKSIDNFIYETKDIMPNKNQLKGSITKNIPDRKQRTNKKLVPTNKKLDPKNSFPRSASQKYNYKKTPVNDGDTRYLHVSPIGSASKRPTHNVQVNNPIPMDTQNYVAPPRYSSLMPNHFENEMYYAQPNTRQIHQHSFNAPRHSDHNMDPHGQQIANSMNYRANQYNSLDDGVIPSSTTMYSMQGPAQSRYQKHASPDFMYVSEDQVLQPSSQHHMSNKMPNDRQIASSDKLHLNNKQNLQAQESRSLENSPYTKLRPASAAIQNKRRSNQTIEEEQESKSSKEDIHKYREGKSANKHLRNNTHFDNSENDENMLVNDETVYTSNQGVRYRKVIEDGKSDGKQRASHNYDSFSRQIEDGSKDDFHTNQGNQMTFL